MKVCLMGVGAIGSLHLEAYARHKDDIVIGVVESDEVKRRKYQNVAEKVYGSIDAAIHDSYDLYDICLPTPLHLETLQYLLQHTTARILCEKPLVLNAAELQVLSKQTADYRDRVKCAFVERFNEPYYYAKQWVERNKGPYEIVCERRTKKPAHATWLDQTGTGSDMLLDLGIHDIDAAVWWTGSSIESVSAQPIHDDRQTVTIRLHDGSTVTITAGWDLPEDSPQGIINTFRIANNNQFISYDTNGETINESGDIRSVIPRFPSAYYSEIDTFLGKQPAQYGRFPSVHELSKAYEIMNAVQEGNQS